MNQEDPALLQRNDRASRRRIVLAGVALALEGGCAGRCGRTAQRGASMSNPSPTFKGGDAIRVSLVFENTTDKELPYGAQAKDFDYPLDCRDERGERVPLTRYGHQMEANRGEGRYILSQLGPGQSLKNEILVSRHVDLTLPGKYTLKVTREVFPSRGSGEEPVASNTCSFEVIDD
jgi:hypothetical protein